MASLLTFNTVFMLIIWVGGVQKGQKYADVIYLGMAPALITCQMDDNDGCKVHEKTRQIEVGSQNSSLTFVVRLKLN